MNLLKVATLLLILAITGCGKSAGERQLDEKSKELKVREDQLKLREKQIDLRETALNQLQKRLDSLQSDADTVGIHNPELIGTWKVTMNCIETNCEGSAIGDTKTEQWNISYENDRVVARAMANKEVIRAYRGLFKENTLRLAAPEAPGQDIHMNVVLSPHPTAKGLMEGQRIIVRAGSCRTVYTLKAEKQ